MEEFETISKLGQYAKTQEFAARSSDFFWRIITDSEHYSKELIENVINKFSDMIKYKGMEKKQAYFDRLTGQLTSSNTAIPVIRFMTKLIKDQKLVSSVTSNTYGAASTTTTVTYGSSTSASKGTTGGESIYPA